MREPILPGQVEFTTTPGGSVLAETPHMTTDTRQVTSRVEFERQLADLVETAAQNGVDPRGPWAVPDDPGPPEYEALITAVSSE